MLELCLDQQSSMNMVQQQVPQSIPDFGSWLTVALSDSKSIPTRAGRFDWKPGHRSSASSRFPFHTVAGKHFRGSSVSLELDAVVVRWRDGYNRLTRPVPVSY